jgi:hypothetical protein
MCVVIMVLLALLMGLGVLFGTQAVVVDMGYGMQQQGVMQNAADAGAMAVGRLMASSVSLDNSGNVVYALTDNQIHQQVADFADDNYGTGLKSSTRAIAVQYLACPGSAEGTPNFTAKSDANLVSSLHGTRLSASKADNLGVGNAPDWNWSSSICMVRVWTRESHAPILAGIIGQTGSEQELAKATVRIAPTTQPTTFTDVWPITHFDDPSNPDPSCAFEIPGCSVPFWGPQNLNNFKMLVDLSEYSAIGGSGTREQLFAPNLTGSTRLDQNCSLLPLFGNTPCYDPTWPGTHSKQTDLGHWLTNGWNGHLYVPNESDPKCTDPSRIVQQCPNSRLEMFGGDLGSNISVPLDTYIANHPASPTCSCADVTIFFWRYGEQSIDPGTNIGTVWNSQTKADKNSTPQRIIVEKVRRFRFSTTGINSKNNSISGYFVGFYNPGGTPGDGPPNNLANTAILVG